MFDATATIPAHHPTERATQSCRTGSVDLHGIDNPLVFQHGDDFRTALGSSPE